MLTNARVATMDERQAAFGFIENGAIAIEGDSISWCGPLADLPKEFSGGPRMDLGGRLVTPGLIDCHTHLVFGGDRAREFELRLQGASYEQIAREGGGIVSTVAMTRAASEAELLTAALKRVDALISEGVTSIESYESAFDGDSRRLTISVTINTEYGPATVQEVL